MSTDTADSGDVEAVTVWLAVAAGEAAVRADSDLARLWVREKLGPGEWRPGSGGGSVFHPEGTGEETGEIHLVEIPDAIALVAQHPAGIER